ncbi:S8 family serine peptidase [Candidatus Methanodesulfokora washburnensis]|uniref:Peptidase S8/S53 domain-containing protein n=1 Tax=Candidatus Methanodesulfokora washburnensis TaxID=2478471 RepID=A0A3R9QW05_9CREN|nr:S8 family serine peptidase [Candidatus Methanodesulfokores washburnensis]RSN74682.1 hypothetical protein D6D85_07460 [Candidatus Methanodesulfokores washburnensis]
MSRNGVGKVCILVLVSLLLFQTATPLYTQGDRTGGLQGSSVNQRTIEKTYDVKLITGDVVKVGLVNKTLQVLAIMPVDPTELNKGFRVFRDGKGLYVIPSNVDLRKFDIELFNVEYLVEEGYWNQSEIPVIIQMKREGYPSISSLIAERGGEIAPVYRLVPASAAKIPVNKARDVVKDLVSNAYMEKIWLDRKVHVHLNESVPLIGAPSVWSLYNGSGVKIAILDTGIDKNHEDFFFPNGTSKIKVEVDFTDDYDTFDHFGHGTHVASIAAGTGEKSIITPMVSEIQSAISRSYDDRFARISTNGTHIAMVWYSYYSGNWDIWFSLYDGHNWASPQQLTTDGNLDVYPFVTFLKDGRILVLWASNRTGNYQIWYKVYDNGVWSQDKHLTTGPDWHVYSPVTQLSNGSIAITYTSNASSNEDVWFAILNLDSSNTLNWVSNRRLTSANSTMWLYSSSIVQSPDGRIWAFIYDIYHFNFTTNIGGITQIYYNVSTDMGTTWSGGLLASGSGFVNPSAAVLPDGTMMLVFEGDDLARNITYTIWYMVYQNNTWSQPRILTPGKYLAVPSIVYAANLGKFCITAQNWINSDLENDIFLLTIPIFRGVAPGATLWNVKVLNRYGVGYEDWVISGIEYAALGPDGKANTGDEADIISMSLGASYWSDGTDPLSLACDRAVDLGRIVVVAAGNVAGYFTVGIPAASKKAITVGASTKQDEIAGFSSRGSTRDFRIKPDVVAPGYRIWAALARGSMIEKWAMNGRIPAIDVDGDGVYDYVRLSGTSMATPHVSGAAALIKQARGFDPNTVKNVLISTSKDLGYDVYTQGGGRINVPAAMETQLIPDPATFSLGGVAGGVYNFNITFRNTGTSWINITLSPSLKEVFYGYDMTDKVSLNSTELNIPAGGQKAVNVEINATSLPSGLYSGVVVTNYTVEGSDVHVIFGLLRMNVVHVRFLGLDGNPLGNAFVGAFKAYPSCEEMERGTARWTWGITDENGAIDLNLPWSGTYYIIGADWYKQYYADAYAVNKTNVTGDMSVTLDLRNAHKLSYSPPGHVIASLSDGLFYYYVNRTCMRGIAYAFWNWWYYPSVTDIYVTQTDLTLGLYYQYYDRKYINVVDPSTLISPELYAIAFSKTNVTKDEMLTYNEADLAKVIKEYRTALTPSIGALMHRDYVLILTDKGSGWTYPFGMPSLSWAISSPRQVTEYITPGMYWTGYDKRNDQPGVITPYFSYWAEEGYPIPGTYSIASNAHPLRPALRLGVYGDYLDVLGVFESPYLNTSKGEIYYKYEPLGSALLNLVVKRNGTVIYNRSTWGLIRTSLSISPPAEIEIDLRGESLMRLSGYAYMSTKFNISKGEGWWKLLDIIPYIEGLDMNNSHAPGNVTGHLVSGPIYPFNVKSVEYSLDDGKTWSTVQTQLIRINTLYGSILDYKFLLKNISEGNYVSIRVNFTDNKTISSFTVLRGFYIRSALPSVPMAEIAGAYVDKGVIKMAVYAECTSPITQIQYSVDGNITGAVPVGNVTATTVEIAINGTSYSDGMHTIGIRAFTSSGSGPWVYKRFYVRTLSNRYNLIAPFLPVPSSYRASDVARAIGPSVTLIAGWDTGKQRFFGYIPGVSKPEEDFLFSQGYGYFIHLTSPQRYVEVEG